LQRVNKGIKRIKIERIKIKRIKIKRIETNCITQRACNATHTKHGQAITANHSTTPLPPPQLLNRIPPPVFKRARISPQLLNACAARAADGAHFGLPPRMLWPHVVKGRRVSA
jgi:hypothetical protein